MILDCPSCRARYLVQSNLFAQSGRQVRCARCKYQWYASLPTNIDIFVPTQSAVEYQSSSQTQFTATSVAHEGSASHFSPQLPAVIKNWNWRRAFWPCVITITIISVLILLFVWDRDQIVKIFPGLKETYQHYGLNIEQSGKGLIFDQVKSELKYDGGTMRLIVDGIIHNTTPDMQLIPDIKARALGPDQDIIQSWWVPAPAATVVAQGDVPFHTEVNAPMKRTIEKVYLEFYAQDEKGDAVQ